LIASSDEIAILLVGLWESATPSESGTTEVCVDALASGRAGPQGFVGDRHLGFVCNQGDAADALTRGALAVSPTTANCGIRTLNVEGPILLE
jgi:hypothetical protein